MPTPLICKRCYNDRKAEETECPKCATRGAGIHPEIKRFQDGQSQMVLEGSFDCQSTRIIGLGDTHLSIPAMLIGGTGFALALGGHWFKPLLYIGLPLGVIGSAIVGQQIISGSRKYCLIDFEQTPPYWESNDDRYWIQVRRFFFPNTTPKEADLLDGIGGKSSTPKVLKAFGAAVAVLAIWIGYQTYVTFAEKKAGLRTGLSADAVRARELFEKRNAGGRGTIHEAARKGDSEELEALLRSGSSANARGAQNRTPLHEAAEAGQVDAVRRLVARGADPSLKDAQGKTASDLADKAGHKDIASDLKAYQEARTKKPAADDEPTPAPTAAQDGAVDLKDFLVAEPGTRTVLDHGGPWDAWGEMRETRVRETSTGELQLQNLDYQSLEASSTRSEVLRVEPVSIVRSNAEGSRSENRFGKLYSRLQSGEIIVSLTSTLETAAGKVGPCLVTYAFLNDDEQRETFYCKGYGISSVQRRDREEKLLENWSLKARLWMNGDSDPSPTRAVFEIAFDQGLCERGDADRCYMAAVSSECQGDSGQALSLYQAACRSRPHACLSLGSLEQRLEHSDQARSAFRKGCEQGDQRACKQLAKIHAETTPAAPVAAATPTPPVTAPAPITSPAPAPEATAAEATPASEPSRAPATSP